MNNGNSHSLFTISLSRYIKCTGTNVTDIRKSTDHLPGFMRKMERKDCFFLSEPKDADIRYIAALLFAKSPGKPLNHKTS